ncbi:stress activated mitogen activated protein kinase interacting protein [Trichoderma gracile]
MSLIQLEELVTYQLRTGYLNEIADGVGERLISVNDSSINTVPFKSAGWRPNSSHVKRTHSPPIPTAIASEYFQAPRQAGLTLEDRFEDGGMLTGGGADTMGPGAATKRRRRREQMEEDDSSDFSDESEDESEHRAAQQIKFAKMPVRHRAGSSPGQASHLQPMNVSPRAPRRGSQSSLNILPGRPRRDTVTSSEVSSENEFDVPAAYRHREAARAATRAMRMQDKINEEPSQAVHPGDPSLLREEDEDDDSDEGSDISGEYVASIDEASILDVVENNPITASPTRQVVGTPPRNFMRQSTIRNSAHPPLSVFNALPPPRPMSTIRPLSVVQPQSLLSAALKAKRFKSSVPFQKFAHLNGEGTQGAISVRIYAAFSKTPSKYLEVLIRPRVQTGQGVERAVTIADLIGLSLYKYNEEKREPPIPPKKRNINWYTLVMVEEGGEVDDDFPPFDRTKPLTSATTVNNAHLRGGGRTRSNSKVYDEFAIVEATEAEYEANQKQTPQEDEEEEEAQPAQDTIAEEGTTPERGENASAGAGAGANANASGMLAPPSSVHPRPNPILTTAYRPNVLLADAPQTRTNVSNAMRGQQKLLRIYIMSSDVAAGQMVTLDITTDMYFAEVLDQVCRKRHLDKANHVLKLPGSGALVMLDRPVSSIGNVTDLELYRRRFATDGPLAITGSPGTSSPKTVPMLDGPPPRKGHKKGGYTPGSHPLAREVMQPDELPSANYKRYTVWRKQPMRIVGMSERVLVIDGEYIHIVPSSGGKAVQEGGKTTTVHFSNVIGCKVPRKHPTNVKLVVYKATESKRYDFEARSADEAAEIVAELKKGISPYREV